VVGRQMSVNFEPGARPLGHRLEAVAISLSYPPNLDLRNGRRQTSAPVAGREAMMTIFLLNTCAVTEPADYSGVSLA